MASEQKSKKFRLNLEFSPNVEEKLQRLKTKSDSASFTEVIRRSLALFDLYVEQAESGGEVIFRDSDGSEEKLKIL